MTNDPVKVLESMLARARADKQNIEKLRDKFPLTNASMRKIVVGRIGALEEALKVIRDGRVLREMGDGRDVSVVEKPTLFSGFPPRDVDGLLIEAGHDPLS